MAGEELTKYIEHIQDEMEIEDPSIAKHFAQEAVKIGGDIQDFINNWEAFSMEEDVMPTRDHIDTFFATVKERRQKRARAKNLTPIPVQQKSLPLKLSKKQTPTFGTPPLQTSFSESKPKLTPTFGSQTPKFGSQTPKFGSQASSKYSARTNSGQTVHTFQESLPEASGERPSLLPRITIKSQKTAKHQFLWEKVQEVTASQLDKVQTFAEAFRIEKTISGEVEINEDEDFFEDLDRPCQNESYFVGRLWNNQPRPIPPARMNHNSFFLENVVNVNETEVPVAVKLNVSAVDTYSLFGGQVVIVQGTNPTGEEILATQIHYDFSLPHSRDMHEEAPVVRPLKEQACRAHRDGLGLVVDVAVGPFICDDEFGFKFAEPLHDLVSRSKDVHADALVLCGPFVDEKSKSILSCERSYENEFLLFLQQFRVHLEEQNMQRTSVIFVPSTRDAFHWPSFPQTAYDNTSAYDRKWFIPMQQLSRDLPWHFLPNPCQFTIDHVSFGISNLEIIDMSKSLITKNLKENRLTECVSQYVRQQSFYPLFPAYSAHVDYSNMENFELKASPDVLIMPSKMKKFSTRAGKSVYINPGHLTVGHSGGTFGRIHVNYSDGEQLGEKIRVDVFRI